MEFKKAIVRTPCHNMISGLTSSNLGTPIYAIALKQHKKYVKALESCGLTVYRMQADETYPDSCFIEDTAIVNQKIVVICNMSESTRSGEEVNVRLKLLEFHPQEKIHTIISPGTLDGGDCMRVENTYFIGISNRTNFEGANQLKNVLSKHGFTVKFVTFDHCLHLKSELNYLGENILLITKQFVKNPLFQDYHHIIVDSDEKYAANSLCINDTVLIPEGFPITKKSIIDHGFNILELEMSEFQKLDGGLSCLSLRF